jgi:hypothetical protein
MDRTAGGEADLMIHKPTGIRRLRGPTRQWQWRVFPVAVTILLLSALACSAGTPSPTVAQPTSTEQTSPTPQTSIFDTGRTAYGFFPSSPELTPESFVATLEAIGQHADVILTMPQVPWAEFIDGPDAESPTIEDMQGTIGLAQRNGLEVIFVIDPLQAFDRSTIATFPPELAGSDFSTPGVRQAFTNFALRLVREFRPRYLGLGSEINTYADAHPEDFDNYVSLYRETYAAVKAEAPETQIFVTFQWEDLNSVGPFADDSPGRIKWEIVETFEPDLDVWAISTYPYFAFGDSAIPPDYYTPLLSRTSRPLAIGEGGYLSEDAGSFKGSPEGQVAYLETIDSQIGERLAFWVYLIIDDVNVEAYARHLSEHGSPAEVEAVALFGTVGLRTSDGDPKPALETWDRLRGTK